MSEIWTAPTTAAEDLTAAARRKVFFGHQSVGMNVIGGIPGVFAAQGLPAPAIVQVAADGGQQTLPGGEDGVLAHAYIGQNGEPVQKLRDFDAMIRGGLAQQIDVALMKLCYVDVTSGTDVDALFREYRTTMAAVEHDFPAVTFIHVTTPLTTEPGIKATIKRLLGRPDSSRADNVARERLNRLMRQEYGSDRLFDLAAVESTAPDGTRVSGSFEGQDYFALYNGYAADNGHLNNVGSQLAAARLLGLVANLAGR